VQQLDTHPQKKIQEVIIIVVSTDGSGNFTTIQAAIDSIPFRTSNLWRSTSRKASTGYIPNNNSSSDFGLQSL
jgi:pectin methylesterase-like acyl-CoA thioesterase